MHLVVVGHGKLFADGAKGTPWQNFQLRNLKRSSLKLRAQLTSAGYMLHPITRV